MSRITEAQNLFVKRFSVLCLIANSLGYLTAYGDGYRDDRCKYGHPASLHRMRLAHDLILRDQGGKVLGKRDHAILHKKWSKLGGNPMIEGDSNHYSWPWAGVI